jgi:NADH-quinone oxidoreductase subunit J
VSLDVIVFGVTFVVAFGSSLAMIFAKNAVHVALFLVASQVALAFAFLLQGAFFIAAVQIIIYAGAIMVLFVFVVMMLNLGPAGVAQERQWLQPRMWIGPSILAMILAAELLYLLSYSGGERSGTRQVEPKEVGMALFGPYLIGVELAAMLLMAAMVGAYHLGRRRVVPRRVEDRHGFDSDGTGAVVGRRPVRAGADRPVGAP